jgi:hypothetical protein
MRIGMNGYTPFVYLGEKSTGKRIQLAIDKRLQNYVKSKEPNNTTIMSSGTSYPVLKQQIITEYNQHELTTLIADQLQTAVVYSVYKSSDEHTKTCFADAIAQKIADWMSNEFGITGVSKDYMVHSGYMPFTKRGAIAVVQINPKLPAGETIASMIPKNGFDFLVKRPKPPLADRMAATAYKWLTSNF